MGPFGNAQDLKRFYAEACAASVLDHPNIVPLLEYDMHQRHYFLAMRFIEGSSFVPYFWIRRPSTHDEAESLDGVMRVLAKRC